MNISTGVMSCSFKNGITARICIWQWRLTGAPFAIAARPTLSFLVSHVHDWTEVGEPLPHKSICYAPGTSKTLLLGLPSYNTIHKEDCVTYLITTRFNDYLLIFLFLIKHVCCKTDFVDNLYEFSWQIKIIIIIASALIMMYNLLFSNIKSKWSSEHRIT